MKKSKPLKWMGLGMGLLIVVSGFGALAFKISWWQSLFSLIMIPFMLLAPGWGWANFYAKDSTDQWVNAGLWSITLVVITAYLLREFAFQEITNSLIILAILIPSGLGFCVQIFSKFLSNESQ